MNKSIDWECIECDGRGSRSSDCNIDKEIIHTRFIELTGLRRLPFLSEDQNRRLNKLIKLKERDNKMTKNRVFKGE